MLAPPRCVGKEENKRIAANQASYGTKPYILTVLFVTEEGVLPLRAASLPGRKAQRLCFGPSHEKRKKKKVKLLTPARRGFH